MPSWTKKVTGLSLDGWTERLRHAFAGASLQQQHCAATLFWWGERPTAGLLASKAYYWCQDFVPLNPTCKLDQSGGQKGSVSSSAPSM